MHQRYIKLEKRLLLFLLCRRKH